MRYQIQFLGFFLKKTHTVWLKPKKLVLGAHFPPIWCSIVVLTFYLEKISIWAITVLTLGLNNKFGSSLKLLTHISNERRTNTCQQIWCVCLMGSLKIVYHSHTANASKQIVIQSLMLNKHPLTFAQLPTFKGTLPNANKGICHCSFAFTVHIYSFWTNECVRLLFVWSSFGICARDFK